MEEGELILGRVSLNAYRIGDKQRQVHPVIEILDSGGNSEGELVVLKCLKHNNSYYWGRIDIGEEEIPPEIKKELMKRIREVEEGKTYTTNQVKNILFPKKKTK